MKKKILFSVILSTFFIIFTACQANTEVLDGAVEYQLSSDSKGSFEIGETVEILIGINTHGASVLAGQIYLDYNPEFLKIKDSSIQTSESDFSLWTVKRVQNSQVQLTFAKPSPGVKTENGQIATIELIAKKAGTTNLSFDRQQSLAKNEKREDILQKERLKDISIEIKETQEK